MFVRIIVLKLGNFMTDPQDRQIEAAKISSRF